MPTTITWNDGVNPASSFTISDEMLSSLDQFRQTITSFQDGQMIPTYSNVQTMFVGIYTKSMVAPALQLFPTTEVQTAQTALVAAQAALATAQAASIPGFVPVTS